MYKTLTITVYLPLFSISNLKNAFISGLRKVSMLWTGPDSHASVRLQSGEALAVCSGLQSWKLSEAVGSSEENQTLVT